MTDKDLIKIANKAKEFSYSPYSKFKVGAALLTQEGKVYTGCNIENISFGATNCAERTALFKAISEGERNFCKLAIMSSSKDFTFPCGICRQVLFEFMPNGEIILGNSNDEIKTLKMTELMPYQFYEDLRS